MGYRFAAEYNHAQERLYTCHFYAILAGPRFVEIQKYCFLPWQRDVTTSLSIRKETCLPLERLLRFSLKKFNVIITRIIGVRTNMDQGSMDPLSWAGFMDSFLK